MRNRTTAAIGGLVLGLSGMLLTPTAASAGTWTDTDPYDPGKFKHDISRIKVTHGPKNLWVRASFWPRVGSPNVTEAWIDTRPGKPGPEFAARRNDGWPRMIQVDRVRRWDYWNSTERRCPRATVRMVSGDVLMKVPRRCLKLGGRKPARVRVTVSSHDEQFVWRTQDWAPRKERFGRHFVRSS